VFLKVETRGGDMSRKQYILLAVIALIGGMIGGIASTHLLPSKVAFAQKQKEIHADTIYAKDFQLVDKHGDGPRIQLTTDREGNPDLFIRDKKDVIRFMLNVTRNGAFLSLSGEKGRPVIILTERGLYGHQEPSLTMYSPNNRTRIKIGFLDNYPIVSLEDPILAKDGSDTLGLSRSIDLSLERKDGARLRLSDAEGNIRALLGIVSLEDPILRETFLNTKTGVVIKKPFSSLTLYNRKGRVIWSAP